jgi:hypothetical protein
MALMADAKNIISNPSSFSPKRDLQREKMIYKCKGAIKFKNYTYKLQLRKGHKLKTNKSTAYVRKMAG